VAGANAVIGRRRLEQPKPGDHQTISLAGQRRRQYRVTLRIARQLLSKANQVLPLERRTSAFDFHDWGNDDCALWPRLATSASSPPINPAYNSLSGLERKAGRAAGDAQSNPFIDSDGCQRVVETSERTYLKQLEQKHQR